LTRVKAKAWKQAHHISGSRVETRRRFQATGKLDSTCKLSSPELSMSF
jgi:hypothetical protein